jgi:hypothetical protein
MDTGLMDKSLNEDNYEEYIDKIINIFRLSSKESSILFDLVIKDYKCTMKLSVVSQNGDREEFSDAIFKCDENFYKNFLDVLVKEFIDNNNITVKDIVNLDNDSLVTFRLITDNNDLFTVDGLSLEHAKHLDSLKDRDDNKIFLDVPNNSGVGNIWIFLLMVVVIVIVFLLIIYLIG